jgi:hypothetical protein
MAKKLLDVAKDIQKNKGTNRPKEQIELALAWVRGEVSISSISKTLGVKGASAYVRLAFLLKQHILEQE